MLKLIIVWIFAIFFMVNALLATMQSSPNAGIYLLWGIAIALIFYGIFHERIDQFCAAGIGRGLKILFFIGVGIYGVLFLFVAVSGYTQSAKGDEKAIVILGAGLRGNEVNGVLRRRMEAALEAHTENPEAYIVVTGGQGANEVIPEAQAMFNWLVRHGVPEDRIIQEDKSTSTEENLLFAQNLLAEKGIGAEEPVVIVTNAFHCYRARQYAKKVGYALPRTHAASMSPVSILPSYLREVLALCYMWVFRRGDLL